MNKQDLSFLVVEDEAELRELTAEILQDYGYQIFQACNGEEGLMLLDQHKIDAVISDIRMPKMDGIEMLKKIRLKSLKTPIVFMVSGFATTTASEVLELGANGFASKPYDPKLISDQILAMVEKIGP